MSDLVGNPEDRFSRDIIIIYFFSLFSFIVLQSEFGWAVTKMLFLESRKSNSASGGANLVSCGGNGWVRFWNSTHNTLLAEFVAHSQCKQFCHNAYVQ